MGLSIKNVCPYIFNFVSTDAFIFYYSNVTFASIGQILKNVFPSLTFISFPSKFVLFQFISNILSFKLSSIFILEITLLISLFILSVIYNAVIAQIQQSLINGMINIPLLTFQELFKTLLTVYLVLGLGVGALGSAITMKK